MMEKKLENNLNKKMKYLFLSLKSDILRHQKNNILKIPSEKNHPENPIMNSVNFKNVLNMDLLEFTTFEESAFFNKRYDTIFSFGLHYLTQLDYFVFNGKGLHNIDMDDMELLMKRVVRRKGKYEYGRTILLKEIDLNRSAGIIYFTKEAKKNIKDAKLDKKIIKFDLIKKRDQSFKLFNEFDEKIKNNSLVEFQWK